MAALVSPEPRAGAAGLSRIDPPLQGGPSLAADRNGKAFRSPCANPPCSGEFGKGQASRNGHPTVEPIYTATDLEEAGGRRLRRDRRSCEAPSTHDQADVNRRGPCVSHDDTAIMRRPSRRGSGTHGRPSPTAATLQGRPEFGSTARPRRLARPGRVGRPRGRSRMHGSN